MYNQNYTLLLSTAINPHLLLTTMDAIKSAGKAAPKPERSVQLIHVCIALPSTADVSHINCIRGEILGKESFVVAFEKIVTDCQSMKIR